MSSGQTSSCVFPTEIFRSTSFRLACAFAGFLGGTTLLLFAFIYSQTAGFETRRIDALMGIFVMSVPQNRSGAGGCHFENYLA